ncbi:MAG: hypothetical protein ILM98_07705 [Kiritimatiellae bacterium]|nr:hypothetical protein [Kiritimatiellia bacterium]
MNKKSTHALLPGAIAAGIVLAAIQASSDELGIDWGRKEGIDVPTDQSAVQTDAIRVSDGGAFVKAGDGTLTLPLANLDAIGEVPVEVWDGRLEIQPGAPAAAAVPAPAFIADKAAFWVDAAAAASFVLDGSVVTRWCDRREADSSSPTRYNARPADAASSAVPLDQTLVSQDGRAAVYFGYSNQSSRYMKFYLGNSSASIVNIRHAFVVFGAYDYYSGPLGNKENPDDWFSRAGVASMANSPKYFDIRYGEASPGAFTARHYLDGRRFDPWSSTVKSGFQLWETHFLDYTGTADNFYNHKGSSGRQGGDYLSEVILFTNDLAVVERLQVQEYLLEKWGLAGTARTTRDVAVTVAPDAVAGIANAAALEFPTSTVTRLRGVGTLEKTGAGELTVDHRSLDLADYEGELDLAGGSLFVRRGALPALKLSGGDTIAFAPYSRSGADNGSVEGYEGYGFSLTRTAGGETDRIAKTGSEEVRVHSIPSGVERLDVRAGDLALVATPAGNLVDGPAPIFATIPNGDFEDSFVADTTYNRKNLNTTTPVNHWLKQGSSLVAFIAEDYSPGDKGDHGRATISSYPIRQGFNALTIGNSGSAYTTEAFFPKSGFYEMTVLESSRFHTSGITSSDANFLANPGYDVMIGDDWASAQPVAHRAVANAGNYVEIRIPLGYVEAGTKTFGFKGPQWSTGSTLLLDDIKVRFVGERQPLGLVAIPNGDFESVTNRLIAAGGSNNQAMYPARTNANEAIGWTFDNSNTAVPAAAVVAAYCSPATSKTNYSASGNKELMPYGDHADGLSGSFFLSLYGTAGSAKTSFPVPAGVYRLKGKVAQWGGKINGANARNERPSVVATATVGGQAVALGSVATGDHRMLEYAWPNLLTVAQDGVVELSLAAGAAADSLLVDDLVLENVAAGDGAEEELVSNGSFETADGTESLAGWTKVNPTFGTSAAVTVANPVADAVNNPTYYTASQFGQTPYDGAAYARIYNDGGIYQALTLAPGLYRLSFATHSRYNAGYDKNPIRAWLGDSSGNLVAVIGETKVASIADIVHTWHFRVASRGTYRLYLQGTDFWRTQYASDSKNHCTIIDGVSLKKVRDELAAPALPETLKIVVAEGARLRLDYDGTVDVGRLLLDGAGVRGTVSAATHPDFIQGRGVLNVTGKGEPSTTIIFR